MRAAAVLLVVLVVTLFPAFATEKKPANDWRQWLGNDYSGVFKDVELLEGFLGAGPKILWRVPLKIGWSCPVIYDNLLYVTSLENKEKEAVTCLDAFSGKQLWKYVYPVKYEKVAYGQGGPRAAATVTEKFVYSIGAMGDLLCLDRFTGSIIWEKKLFKAYPPYIKGWKGYSISPLLADNKVIVNLGPDAKKENEMCAAFDALSGKELWLYKRPVKIRTTIQVSQTPRIVELFGEKCVLYSPFARLSVLSLADGKLLFEYPLPEGVNTIATPVVFEGNKILEQPFEKDPVLLEIFGTREKPGVKKLWNTKKLPAGHFSFVYYGGYFYGFASCFNLVAVEAKTGAIAWSKSGLKIDASLALADGKLYIRSGTELIIAKATGKKFEELSSYKFNIDQGRDDFIGWASPIVAHKKLYLRFSEELLCIDLSR
jgi:outer membrane protein assembly factor BamB